METLSPDNALLRSLLPTDREALQAHLDLVEMPTGRVLYEMGDPAAWVYLPISGLLSLITVMVSGTALETSIVGQESGVGFVEALGSGQMRTRVIVQVPGTAYRIRAAGFCKVFDASVAMRKAVRRQIELCLAEDRQAIACHGLHGVRQRFSRWLLECHDLSGRPATMPLRQEFLAVMLGVSRPAVTRIAAACQKDGIIRYSRGVVTLLDFERLEAGACECRDSVKELRMELNRPGSIGSCIH